MSMKPFLEHVDGCRVCQQHPRAPCSAGAALLKEGAQRLTARLVHDPKRAKA
jgi:hypothetical protein